MSRHSKEVHLKGILFWYSLNDKIFSYNTGILYYENLVSLVSCCTLSDDRPCDTSVDWCGWKNERGWKRIKHKNLDQISQSEGGGQEGS